MATALLGCGGGAGPAPEGAARPGAEAGAAAILTQDGVEANNTGAATCTFAGQTYEKGQMIWGFEQPAVDFPAACDSVRVAWICGEKAGASGTPPLFEACTALPADPPLDPSEIGSINSGESASRPEDLANADDRSVTGQCAFGDRFYRPGQTIWGYGQRQVTAPATCESVPAPEPSPEPAASPVPNPSRPEALSDGPFKLATGPSTVAVLANDRLDGRPATPEVVVARVTDDRGAPGAHFDSAGRLVIPPGEGHQPRQIEYEICNRIAPDACARATLEFTRFAMFDATLFSGKPDGGLPGTRPLAVIYSVAPGPGLPDASLIAERIRHARGYGQSHVVLDAEAWVQMTHDRSEREKSMKNYLAVVRAYKAAAPDLKFSLYAIVPAGDYYNAIGLTGQEGLDLYRDTNDLYQPVADEVEALFPSLYTFNENPVLNDRYIIANIEQARRIGRGKPVYAFIWPQYALGGEFKDYRDIPVDYWRRILETVRRHADGVVLWGGWELIHDSGALRWSDSAPWWQETKRFMETLTTVEPR